jgi:dynein assembly factor 2, axonemal
MVNPYASEDFNRIRVNPRDREKEESKGIENPLIPGQKLDMTYKELNTFTKAMKDDEFKKLMSNYVDEISDPKHRPELDQYLDELVERGELPPGAALIQPQSGFCIKTSAKRLTNDKQKKFFEQKCFINVCWHESLEKPR